MAEPRIPPIAPSMDFFGLNMGASLCLPIQIPVRYAQVSQIQELMKIIHTV